MAACLAVFCPAPAVSTCPMITSSTASASMPERSSNARINVAPSCAAGICDSEPWNLPIAVRVAPTITASRIARLRSQRLLAGVDQVRIDLAFGRERSHAEQAALRLQHHLDVDRRRSLPPEIPVVKSDLPEDYSVR